MRKGSRASQGIRSTACCLSVAFCVFLGAGCRSSNLHFRSPEAQRRTSHLGISPRYVYAGTQANARDMITPFSTSGDALYDGCVIMIYPLYIIDLPLSFAMDTLFLPYDVYMVTVGGRDRYGKLDAPPIE